MRIRVNNSRTAGGEVFVPVDPVSPIDLEDFFVVDRFEASETEASPFSEVTVNWTIEPKNPETQFEDFEFRLIGPPQFIEDGIPADSEHAFTLLQPISLRLQGRRTGGPWSSLGPQLSVSVDDSDCRRLTFPGSIVDSFVFDGLRQFSSETAELRLRSGTEPTSEWTTGRISYNFPMEIVTPNFFNADLDLAADVTFVVTHVEEGTDIDVRIDFDLDVDYSTVEDILSLGSSPVIAKTIEKLLPLVLESRKPEIEERFANELFNNSLVENALEDGRLFDVEIRPRSQDTVFDLVEIVVCDEPGGFREPSDAPVTRGVARRGT